SRRAWHLPEPSAMSHRSYKSLLTRREPPPGNHLACPLCDSYIYAEEACGKCFAPAAVIESIARRDHPPRFGGALGPGGVGKTVSLGMLLDLRARGSCGLQGLARGPFSRGLHRTLILALESQRFPEKPPAEPDRWHWVHCEVTT